MMDNNNNRNHNHNHVVFDLSKNKIKTLPSKKQIKKQLRSNISCNSTLQSQLDQLRISDISDYESTDEHTDTEVSGLAHSLMSSKFSGMLVSGILDNHKEPASIITSNNNVLKSQPVKSFHKRQQQQKTKTTKGILKVTSNPHLQEEWGNVCGDKTLNMRLSEIELRRKESLDCSSSMIPALDYSSDCDLCDTKL